MITRTYSLAAISKIRGMLKTRTHTLALAAAATTAAALALPGAASAGVKAHAAKATCKPISLVATHGKKVKPKPYCRLAQVVDGKVPCTNVETAKFRMCRYTPSSGTWLTNKAGEAFAVVGDTITAGGKRSPLGRYQVSTSFKEGELPPCLKPAGKPKATISDSSGAEWASDGATCRKETLGNVENSGPDLVSFAKTKICISNSTHPDGAMGGWDPVQRSYCYTGNGALLVDQYGMEFDQNGVYFPSSGDRCHMYEYFVTQPDGSKVAVQGIAMKTPSLTRTNPAQIIPNTLYRWQPYRSTADHLDGM